ncbi:hypothetical protein ACFXPT_39070, partial [Streptomyces goshikiensis]
VADRGPGLVPARSCREVPGGTGHDRIRASTGLPRSKRFLAKADEEVTANLQVRLILDNYATHKTSDIKRSLLAHPRFHPHFMPTRASHS